MTFANILAPHLWLKGELLKVAIGTENFVVRITSILEPSHDDNSIE